MRQAVPADEYHSAAHPPPRRRPCRRRARAKRARAHWLDRHIPPRQQERGLRGGGAEFQPDIVFSDHASSNFGAREALEYLRATRPTTALIVVTGALSEELIVDYLKAGVSDFVSKANLGRLRPAVETALAVRRKLGRLTPRQTEVLSLLADGNSTSEIARRLNLSIKTIETHRMALMDRLGIHNLAGLIRFALVVGLVPLTA